jgi:hypothetical protein
VTRAAAAQGLVEQLAAFPDRLATAAHAADAAEAAGGRTVAAGDWSASQVIRHLIVVESEVWQGRLDSLASELDPHWNLVEPGFDDGSHHPPLETLLSTFASRRLDTVSRLEALDDTGWSRSGVHAVFGRLDVAGLCRIAIDHDEEHLASLVAPQ